MIDLAAAPVDISITQRLTGGCIDVLKGAVAAGRSKECFENLCRLYVALSRSRHGLYVISTRPKEKSPSPNFVHLLNESLGNAEGEWTGGGATAVKAFESGAWTWVEAFESDSAVAEHEQPRVQVKEGRTWCIDYVVKNLQ